MRAKRTNWRVEQLDSMYKSAVRGRIKLWVERDGKMVHVVPTLSEARKAAEGIQALLDVANGDLSMHAAEAIWKRR